MENDVNLEFSVISLLIVGATIIALVKFVPLIYAPIAMPLAAFTVAGVIFGIGKILR